MLQLCSRIGLIFVLEQVTRVTKEWQLCQILLKGSQDEVCKLREEIATCHFYHQLHREELCEATRLLVAEQQLTARLRQQNGEGGWSPPIPPVPGAKCPHCFNSPPGSYLMQAAFVLVLPAYIHSCPASIALSMRPLLDAGPGYSTASALMPGIPDYGVLRLRELACDCRAKDSVISDAASHTSSSPPSPHRRRHPADALQQFPAARGACVSS